MLGTGGQFSLSLPLLWLHVSGKNNLKEKKIWTEKGR